MDKDNENYVSEFSRGIASTAWCKKSTSNIELIPELAEEFAKILGKYINALRWCGGSKDFQVGGGAEIGWEKIVRPLIQ